MELGKGFYFAFNFLIESLWQEQESLLEESVLGMQFIRLHAISNVVQ